VNPPDLSLEMLIVIGALLTAIGLGIGILMGRSMSPDRQRYLETERKLDQALQEKKAYEDEVVSHFSQTAKLLNNLTESYREVHNQLASGAANLCRDVGPVPLGRLDNARREDGEIPEDLVNITPPLDYAPKTFPDETGMLNESFGIERKKGGEDSASPEKA
jgi:uncharacterized membrane-anchored protein YhcB (DUF1043 family)